MNNIVSFLIDFICIFLILFLIYFVFIIKKKKNFEKLKKNDYIRLFVIRYDINVKKINYSQLVRVLSLINIFILSFTSALIVNIDGLIWKIIISFIVIFVFIYSLYEIAGRYFKKMEGKKKCTISKK